MNPATIIQGAQNDGVILVLTPSGTIKAKGDSEAVNRWLTVLCENKASIIEHLKVCDDNKATRPLAAIEARAIRGWLNYIGETEPVVIAEVLENCRRDTSARDYFLGRAAAELREFGASRNWIMRGDKYGQ